MDSLTDERLDMGGELVAVIELAHGEARVAAAAAKDDFNSTVMLLGPSAVTAVGGAFFGGPTGAVIAQGLVANVVVGAAADWALKTDHELDVYRSLWLDQADWGAGIDDQIMATLQFDGAIDLSGIGGTASIGGETIAIGLLGQPEAVTIGVLESRMNDVSQRRNEFGEDYRLLLQASAEN